MLLLDTCTLLWLAADQKKLSSKARKAIEHNADALFVSAISGFEIAVKCRSRKMELPVPVKQWFDQVIDFHGVREIAITGEIAVHSAELPLLHNDPCDRIIVATAQLQGMDIVTCDKTIGQYNIKVIW